MKAGPNLAELSAADLAKAFAGVSPVPLGERTLEVLAVHYRELQRWNRSLSLIGPGTVTAVIERHYGEALAALPWIDRTWTQLVDVGSGGGFPGLVLAAAVPALRATLVEPRGRKWTFLQSVARKASLPCRCLDARVDAPLPPGLPEQIDLVTVRALKLPVATLEALARRLSPGGRIFLWVGQEVPALPECLIVDAEVKLRGGESRRIHSYRLAESLGHEALAGQSP